MMIRRDRYRNRRIVSGKDRVVISSLAGFVLCLLLGAALLSSMGCASAKVSAQAPSRTMISNVLVEDYTISISADQPFTYTLYKPGDPYKIVVDMPDVSVGAFSAKINPQKKGISEVVPVQVESPSFLARFEILLDTPSAVDQEYKNNVLTIRVKDDGFSKPVAAKWQEVPKELKIPAIERKERAVASPKESRGSETARPLAQAQLPKATEITGFAFDSSAGAVMLHIRGNGAMTPNVFPLENRLVLDFSDVALNAAIPTEVVTPFRGIRSGRHDGKTRIVIDLKENSTFDVSTAENAVLVTVKREKEPAVARAAPMRYERAEAETRFPTAEAEASPRSKCQSYLEGKEAINFDFQDQDIVPIFRLFADISGCNLFVHPDVKGKATMKFIDVSWSQALDTILKTFSLGKSVEGNIIRIAPHSVFQKESEEKAKAMEAVSLAEPLDTRIYSVSYAKVKDVDAAIKSAKLLTPRGSTSVDERTSTILVQDIDDVFPKVESLLSTLDKPTPQVLIEARIVEVNTAAKRDLGIQWGMNIQGSNTLSSLGGLSGVPFLSRGPFTGKNYLVDFPAKSVGALSGSGFTFGFLSPDRTFGLDLQLSALETIGHGKIISSPKILTIDNGKAKISQGNSIAVRKLTAEGTVSTEFKDVTLELNVTPRITPDKSIGIAIEIKKEELDFSVVSVDGIPGTSKKEANTNVIIKDGETMVIGGIYKTKTDDTESGVPGLMKIPVLGWLFKSKLKETRTDELLIFITPRIVERP